METKEHCKQVRESALEKFKRELGYTLFSQNSNQSSGNAKNVEKLQCYQDMVCLNWWNQNQLYRPRLWAQTKDFGFNHAKHTVKYKNILFRGNEIKIKKEPVWPYMYNNLKLILPELIFSIILIIEINVAAEIGHDEMSRLISRTDVSTYFFTAMVTKYEENHVC